MADYSQAIGRGMQLWSQVRSNLARASQQMAAIRFKEKKDRQDSASAIRFLAGSGLISEPEFGRLMMELNQGRYVDPDVVTKMIDIRDRQSQHMQMVAQQQATQKLAEKRYQMDLDKMQFEQKQDIEEAQRQRGKIAEEHRTYADLDKPISNLLSVADRLMKLGKVEGGGGGLIGPGWSPEQFGQARQSAHPFEKAIIGLVGRARHLAGLQAGVRGGTLPENTREALRLLSENGSTEAVRQALDLIPPAQKQRIMSMIPESYAENPAYAGTGEPTTIPEGQRLGQAAQTLYEMLNLGVSSPPYMPPLTPRSQNQSPMGAVPGGADLSGMSDSDLEEQLYEVMRRAMAAESGG